MKGGKVGRTWKQQRDPENQLCANAIFGCDKERVFQIRKGYYGSQWCNKCDKWKRRGLTYSQGVALYVDKTVMCYVCEYRVAQAVDHDHTICPQGWHACVKCFRGFACDRCNRHAITNIDRIVDGSGGALEFWDLVQFYAQGLKKFYTEKAGEVK